MTDTIITQSEADDIRTELRNQADQFGVVDFEDAYAILTRTYQPEFDRQGKVTNAREAMRDLYTRKPHLFIKRATSMGAAEYAKARGDLTQQPPTFTSADANTMSRKEFKKAKDALAMHDHKHVAYLSRK